MTKSIDSMHSIPFNQISWEYYAKRMGVYRIYIWTGCESESDIAKKNGEQHFKWFSMKRIRFGLKLSSLSFVYSSVASHRTFTIKWFTKSVNECVRNETHTPQYFLWCVDSGISKNLCKRESSPPIKTQICVRRGDNSRRSLSVSSVQLISVESTIIISWWSSSSILFSRDRKICNLMT